MSVGASAGVTALIVVPDVPHRAVIIIMVIVNPSARLRVVFWTSEARCAWGHLEGLWGEVLISMFAAAFGDASPRPALPWLG